MCHINGTMSDDIKRDRSPNCPKQTLAQAIELAKTLYSKARQSKIKAVVAASTFGYASLNGSALTAIGVLNQYGLLDKDDAGGLSVSTDAIALLHPKDEAQKLSLLRKSALMPKVFKELYSEGFHNASEDVLSNHLIQSNFSPDAAQKVASVFKANIELAKLNDSGTVGEETLKAEAIAPAESKSSLTGFPTQPSNPPTLTRAETLRAPEAVLASYSVPLGECEVSIIFKGKKLSVEDFDALGEYVQLFKKQYERKVKAIEAQNFVENFGAGLFKGQ